MSTIPLETYHAIMDDVQKRMEASGNSFDVKDTREWYILCAAYQAGLDAGRRSTRT